MITRRDVIKATAAAPFLAGLIMTPVAQADSQDDPKWNNKHTRLALTNEVLTGSLALGGASYPDAAGNVYQTGAVYTGTASGTISGSFRLTLNMFTPAGSTTSSFWGNLTIADSASPANVVFGAVYGQQTPATSGFNDRGSFQLDGGIGSFLNNFGHGSLSGTSTASINTGGSITWTLNSVPGNAGNPPGHAFGNPGHGNGHGNGNGQ